MRYQGRLKKMMIRPNKKNTFASGWFVTKILGGGEFFKVFFHFSHNVYCHPTSKCDSIDDMEVLY